jgi:copper(I)-binding protein
LPLRPDATSASIGGIELQLVRIEHPPGEAHSAGVDVGLYLTLVNRGQDADRLSDATSPDAARVVVVDGVHGSPRQVDMRIGPGSTISMQHPDKTHLELSGLSRALHPGVFVPVTFTFEGAGPVTVKVPVQASSHPIVPHPTSTRSG